MNTYEYAIDCRNRRDYCMYVARLTDWPELRAVTVKKARSFHASYLASCRLAVSEALRNLNRSN